MGSDDLSDIEIYKRYKNHLTILIRVSKKRYFLSKIDECHEKLKKVWSIIKETMNQRWKGEKLPPSFLSGQSEFSTEEAVKRFNKYFLDLPVSPVSPEPAVGLQYVVESLFIIPCSLEEVNRKISSYNNSMSDYVIFGLCSFVMKQGASTIYMPLSQFFNLSFSSGCVLVACKIARVVPLHKKDAPCHIPNYRPIFLLAVFSKILEKFMYGRLVHFLGSYA